MQRGRALARASFVVAALFAAEAPLTAAPTLKGRAVWASPRDAGTTEASVVAFVEQLAKAHVNTLIMELKTSAGLFWPSERFAPAVVEYRAFDLPAVLIRECHQRKIAFHVWFFDFAEGGSSYVAQQHPEWLALSPEGKPTTAEVLRGQPYRMAWMCPARRPGYTDQSRSTPPTTRPRTPTTRSRRPWTALTSRPTGRRARRCCRRTGRTTAAR